MASPQSSAVLNDSNELVPEVRETTSQLANGGDLSGHRMQRMGKWGGLGSPDPILLRTVGITELREVQVEVKGDATTDLLQTTSHVLLEPLQVDREELRRPGRHSHQVRRGIRTRADEKLMRD